MFKYLLFMLLLMAQLCAADNNEVELRVATAANFYPTLKKIAASYSAISKNKITIIRGSTGKLYAQIMQGAPYDIFFSADSVRVEKLVKKNKTRDISKNKKSIVYAIGRLALWTADVDSSQQLREQLFNANFNKLAIANPKTAPYGKASVEALKALELYETVKPKLVYAENISQTLQFVQSGAADLGFVAMAHVKHDMYWEVDSYYHQPIKQKVVILKQSKQIKVAKEFLNYIQSEPIKKIIKADGYEI